MKLRKIVLFEKIVCDVFSISCIVYFPFVHAIDYTCGCLLIDMTCPPQDYWYFKLKPPRGRGEVKGHNKLTEGVRLESAKNFHAQFRAPPLPAMPLPQTHVEMQNVPH